MDRSTSVHIGILGGTFNPIHNGHIELGLQAKKQFSLDSVLVMPNNKPDYKDIPYEVTRVHRENMVKLAVSSVEGFLYSDMELKRPGITYTADTLTCLHRLYPSVSWAFIMGGDSIMHFDRWHHPDIITSLATLLVTTRDNIHEKEVYNKIKSLKSIYPDADIQFIRIPDIRISSSDIRDRLSRGLDIYGMVPDAVRQYIICNKLYLDCK